MSRFCSSPFQVIGEIKKDSKIDITPKAFIHMAISFYSAQPEEYGGSVKSLEFSVANCLENWLRNHKLCIKIEGDNMLFVKDK